MEAFEVLADPTRRRIVELLAGEELSAGEIAGHFEVSGPAISRHLRLLRESGIARYERHGQHRVYRLDVVPLMDADDWMRRMVGAWQRRFRDLGTYLDDMAATGADKRKKEENYR